MNRINRIIFCIIDDLRSSHFFNYIEKGLLPNFKRLMENGLYSKNCITDFPSVTYPTQPTLITGTYTGHYLKEPCHGIPSYSWMGRYYAPPILRSYGGSGSDELIQVYKLNSDLGSNCKTILEMIEEGNKASITQFISRGTDYIFPESKLKLAFYYELISHSKNQKKMMARMNTVVVRKLLDIFQRPKKYFGNNEPPIASHLWFATSDVIMHFFGYDSNLYKLNLMHIDRCMGLLLKGLEDLGYLDDTAIAITSDHGNYKGKRLGDVNNFNRRFGLTPYHPKKNPKGNVNIAEFGSVGLFYFKGSTQVKDKRGWSIPTLKDLKNYGPKRANLLEVLFKIDGTKLLYIRNDDNNYRRGSIKIRFKDPKTAKIKENIIEYRGKSSDFKTKLILDDSEKDAFGYIIDDKACKILDGKFHSIDEWLEFTYHFDYPLYPDLVARHFKNPRSADIILSTCGEVVFNIEHGKQKNDHIYSHDIGLRKSSVVPLIIAGSPEIPNREISFCKTADIVPTLLKLINKRPHQSVIGKSLI
ncbi:MAG: alkaline phosphatase family protein [Promethearchaeota archaeon]